MHAMRFPRAGFRSAIGVTHHTRGVTLVHRGIISLAVLATVGVAACKQAQDPPKAASIVGMNAVDSVAVGKTFNFDVETRDASGKKVTGRRISWSSLNPSIAAVDANGTVTGVAVGGTIITARADGATAQTNFTVQPAVASVVLSPQTSTLAVQATRTLSVSVTDKDGKTISGRTVSFSSSNPAIATVSAEGVVAGVSIGRVTITATTVRELVSGTATVDVVPVSVASVAISPAGAQTVFEGLTLQLSAVLRDANGAVLSGRPVSWTTSNQLVATVSSSGLVTGVSVGSTQITAESEGKTASTTITVAPRPVASIALSPNPGSVKVGQAIQMSVDLRDASGGQLSTAGRTVAWESSNNPVATVQNGVVTGVSQGTATITVTVEGKSASAIVNVTP